MSLMDDFGQGLVAILVFAGVVLAAVYSWHASHKRRQALGAWASSRALSYSTGNDHSLDTTYGCFSCLVKGANRYGYNLMRGHWDGRPLLAFDYHYETYSRDNKGRRRTHHHHFSAVIVEYDLPLKPLLIRPENFLDKVTEFFGWDDIDFESAEFSRTFFVKSPDKKWAYDVIHQRTMEFLLAQPRFTFEFEGRYVIAYRSSRFAVSDFAAASETVSGLLQRLPEFLVKQLKERAG